jgi:anti-sigma factor RsiW
MNNCKAFEQLASTVIDNEATRAERETLYRHLAGCERCDAFLTDAMALQVAAARRGTRSMPISERHSVGSPARRPVRGVVGSTVRQAMKKRLSVPVPVMGVLIALIITIIVVTTRSSDQTPMEQPVHQSEVTQTVLRLPVVRIP